MRIIIAPDSFKGSLTASVAATTIKKAFQSVMPHSEIEAVPMADGGEGTLDAILNAVKGRKVRVQVSGPLQNKISAEYGILSDNQTAVIEMALAAGLTLLSERERNPMLATTVGVGELIVDAMDNGCTTFIIGVGGSATNDGGAGMLHALGVRFLDEGNNEILPVPIDFARIRAVDFSGMDPRIEQCTFKVATDVTNPLLGKQGAAAVFAPQKGASPVEVEELDVLLRHYSDVIERQLQHKLSESPGAGAGGGIGFAFMAIGAELQSGAGTVAELTGLPNKINGSDWVITGEGRTDDQTLYGKLPLYVAQIAKERGVKTILISGSLGTGNERLHDWFVSCHSIATGPQTLQESMLHAERNLAIASENIARLIAAASHY